MKKLVIYTRILLFIILAYTLGSLSANAKDNYLFGGPKLFSYDIDQADVDQLATDLVSLGFSTATVSANDYGGGFDIGIGFPITEMIDIEASFVYMGQFKLTADMTGPTENLTITSDSMSFPIMAKIKFGESDYNFFAKAGWHFWQQDATIATSRGSVELWGKGNDPAYGIGAQLAGFSVSYDIYNFSGIGAGVAGQDSSMSSISATWSMQF